MVRVVVRLADLHLFGADGADLAVRVMVTVWHHLAIIALNDG